MIEPSYYPDWRWVIAVAAVVLLLLVLSYRSAMRVGWVFRTTLIALRAMAMFTVFGLLCDLHRVDKIVHQQPARVAVVLDNSRSMTVQDTAPSRFDFGKESLRQIAANLPTNTAISYYTLGSALQPVNGFESLTATGTVTALGESLEQLASSDAVDGLSAVVLCSDGIETSGKSAANAAHLFRRRELPIFTMLAGTTNGMRDIALQGVEVKRGVSDESPTRVDVEVASYGFANLMVPLQITSRGQVLASQRIRLNGGAARYSIEFKPDRAGFEAYGVSIPPQQGEWLSSNNRRAFGLEVVPNVIRVIYMEGTPGEWHYLRDAVESEGHIKVSGLYPNRDFPATMEELLNYDVIINSDIRKEVFSKEQLNNTVRFVEEFGGGFAMVGGWSAFGSGGYQRTVIDRIIPVAMEEYTDWSKMPFNMSFPPGALDHPLMQIGATKEENEIIWKQKLPRFGGYNRVDRPKPGAVVLGYDAAAQGRYGPLTTLAVQEIGKGRTMAFMSDTTRGWGDLFETIWGEPINPGAPLSERNCDARYYRQFWINAIRWLAAGKVHDTKNSVTLQLAKSYGKPNESIAATVQLRSTNAIPADTSVHLESTDENGDVRMIPANYDPASSTWMGTVQVPSGYYIISAVASRSGQLFGRDKQLLVAEDTDAEMVDVRGNPELMKHIAELSGGAVLNANDAGTNALVAHLQKSSPTSVEFRRTPIWSNWTCLLFLIGLLTIEWAARRARDLA